MAAWNTQMYNRNISSLVRISNVYHRKFAAIFTRSSFNLIALNIIAAAITAAIAANKFNKLVLKNNKSQAASDLFRS